MSKIESICPKCNKLFEKLDSIKSKLCKDCKNVYQREYRVKTKNLSTLKYEKTMNGFIMRMYRNMKSRIYGIQKKKAHLYVGKTLLDKKDFYKLCLCSSVFIDLFEKYTHSDYNQKLAPSPDRIDTNIGYTLENIQFITHSENSRRASLCRK